jgi:hypothetical protein
MESKQEGSPMARRYRIVNAEGKEVQIGDRIELSKRPVLVIEGVTPTHILARFEGDERRTLLRWKPKAFGCRIEEVK